jgi:hypothetical protein
MKELWWLAVLSIVGYALFGASAAAANTISGEITGSEDQTIAELQSLVTTDPSVAHANRLVSKRVTLAGEYTGTVYQRVGKEVREASFQGTFSGEGTLRFSNNRVSGYLTGTGTGSYYDGTVITPWSGGGIGIVRDSTISGLCYGSATVKQNGKRLFTTGITNRESATIAGNTITGSFEAKRGISFLSRRPNYTVNIAGTYTITW